MSLTVYSLTHKSDVKISALIDPAKVGSGLVHKVTKSYNVGSGAPAAYKGHNGLDMCGKNGCGIYSVTDGVVRVNAFDKNGAGNYVSIGADIGGLTYCFVYMHLKKKSKLVKGQKIKKGDLIGYQGNTGNSTGSHLHFGVSVDGRYCDPYWYAIDAKEELFMKYCTGRYKVICTNLNVREEPNTKCKIVGKLNKPDVIEVVGLCLSSTDGAWGKISGGGWCCLLTPDGEAYAEEIAV